MKRITVLFLLISTAGIHFAYGWGDKGHSIIAAIADHHLTPKARKSLQSVLTHPLVYYASWMDNIRKNPLYSETVSWH